MNRVLVTGGSGYIGTMICHKLNHDCLIDKVINYDITNGDDILDTKNLVNYLTTFKINIIIHLAAASTVHICESNPPYAFKQNVMGTKSIISAMKQTGCNHIIFASTSSVYGNDTDKFAYCKKQCIPEEEVQRICCEDDLRINPCSMYGVTKLMGEQIIYNAYLNGHITGSYIFFRMFNVIGPSLTKLKNNGSDRLIGALESGSITIYGTDYDTKDGTCERDYISLYDTVNGYIKGIHKITSTVGVDFRETINICTGSVTSVREILTHWKKYSPCVVQYGDKRKGDPVTVCGDPQKARNVLGWRATKKIDDIVFDLNIINNNKISK